MTEKDIKRTKGAIKIFLNSLDELQEFVVNKLNTARPNQIKLRLDELVSKRVEFIKHQSTLESFDETELESNTRATVDRLYYYLRPALEDRLDELKEEKKTRTPHNVEDLNFSPKLPEIKLDHFAGDITKWKSFLESFDTHVHNNSRLSELTKFQYLNNSLEGIAAKVLENLDFVSSNYEQARQLLIDRFDRENYIVEEHIRLIFNIKPIERLTAQNLLNLLDEFNSHLRSLKNLGRPTDYWDDIIIYLIVSKFDNNTKAKWREDAPINALPTLADITKFIKIRSHSLEGQSLDIVSSSKASKDKYQPPIQNSAQNFKPRSLNSFKPHSKPYVTTSLYANNRFSCVHCKRAGHTIMRCNQFIAMSIDDRINTIRTYHLCENCLRLNHTVKDCPNQEVCRYCKLKHHSLLHVTPSSTIGQSSHCTSLTTKVPTIPLSSNNVQSFTSALTTTTPQSQTTAMLTTTSNYVILATAEVLVSSNCGTTVTARVMLDSGSQLNFITKSLASKLGIQPTPSSAVVQGIGGSSLTLSGAVSLTIKSKFNGYTTNVEAHILSRISNNQPAFNFDISQWNVPHNIQLADSRFHSCQRIDMLIGAESFYELQSVGQLKLGPGLPLLQKTQLGWIVSGTVAMSNKENVSCHLVELNSSDYLNKLMERFWEIDEINDNVDISANPCENQFMSTHRRNDDGRFVVRLPFTQPKPELGESSEMALRRFLNLERRLEENSNLRSAYNQFMADYIELDHMSLEVQPSRNHYYLPHHCVFKPDSSSTTLRVVFDGSAKTTNGKSLNSSLLNGPVVQNELSTILLRFRTHKIAISADITKMYRQILIHPDDQRYQYIFWRFNIQDPVQTYKLQTVTYGTTSAPFLATRCLLQLAKENELDDSVASEAIRQDMYVDDLLTGANSVDEAIQLRLNISTILEGAGFYLRKWCSNEERALDGIDSTNRERVLVFEETEYIKTLGLYWHSVKDCFRIKVSPTIQSTKVTKRMIVSEIAKIYDPIGLVSPVVVIGKFIMQDLWKLKYDWDESLPMQIHTTWHNYRNELEQLQHLYIPRHVFDGSSAPDHIQLHGFADASEKGYGAVLYVRSQTLSGFCTRLLCSKSRVAPLKNKLTLPRLELCAATLLAKLITKYKSIANHNISQVFCWSDSTITLHWIHSDSTRWSRFVANRVQKIQSMSQPAQWFHVNSKNNPADLISRGVQPRAIIDSLLWWEGPTFLSQEDDHWYNPFSANMLNNMPEMKQNVLSLFTAASFRDVDVNEKDDIVNKFTHKTSFLTMQNSMAYVLRFIHNTINPSHRRSGPLSCNEIKDSLKTIIRQTQKICFPEEYKGLKSPHFIIKNSSLQSLSLFMDDDRIIRVGGRLKFAALSYTSKHPALLHPKHFFTITLIAFLHKLNLHVGPQGLLAIVRQNYWPVHGRKVCKAIYRACVICTRAKPIMLKQIMADLPSERVNQALPFCFTAVDYCGPFHVYYNLRGKTSTKAYLSCFVCMVTRSVHLELASSMTTESFMGVLKRFIATRGLPKQILSDNGTNFIGANNHLHDLYNLLNSSKLCQAIKEVTLCDKLEWVFIPPGSPHFGGLHEAAVKVAKHHLRRLTYNKRFTFEEFSTLIKQVEAVLNSRPLVPLFSDNLEILTPAHFLIGRPLRSIPETAEFDSKISILKKWEMVTNLHKQFWTLWSKEYIQQLQQRKFWTTAQPDVREGEIVVIKEENLPPLKWKIGRITKIHPGSDGHVRVVTIKTQNGEITRSITKIAILPVTLEPVQRGGE